MRGFDFSSWQGVLTTLIGLALFALIGIGIRLLVMTTIQQRRERQNRQINERMKTLIAAYKVLGGSFTGNLAVDPSHRRDLKKPASEGADLSAPAPDAADGDDSIGERRRRIRDAVEASLSDIILLGTEEHVRLAERAARELVAGHPVHVQDLVVSLRSFIRGALDLAPIPTDVTIPEQGPTRPQGGGGGGRGGGGRGEGGGAGRGGGGAGGGAGGGGGGSGAGLALGGADDAAGARPGPG